jgi:hypothetical protein
VIMTGGPMGDDEGLSTEEEAAVGRDRAQVG